LTEHKMGMRVARGLMLGLLAVGASGCGGTTSAGPSSAGSAGSSAGGSCEASGGPTAADFSSREAALFCDTLKPCCAAAQLPFDQAACETYFGSDFQGEVSRAGSGAAFDCAAGQRCLDEIARAIQSCSAFDKAELPDCNHLLVGTLPVGAPCTDWKSCAAPVDVFGDCVFDASNTGTCSLEPPSARGKLGDPCGLSCDPYGQCTAETSDPPPQVACYRSDGLYCSGGRCAPLAAVGASCTSEVGCNTPGALCLDSAGQGQSPNSAMPGQCTILPPNGLLATQYLCRGMADPTQN
jgi:hypothetical protein